MGAFGGAGGLHVRGHLFCVLARVRGELPGWSAQGCGLRGSQIPGSRHSSPEAHRWDVAEMYARAGRIAERCGRCMLARGASLRSGRNKIGGTLVRGCGKIYDSHLTCMEKPCIMIDKELL